MASTATLTGSISAITTSGVTTAVISITATQNGVTVATSSATITTSGNNELAGDYSISGLPAGTVGVHFSSVHFNTANMQTSINLNKSNTLNADLLPKGLKI